MRMKSIPGPACHLTRHAKVFGTLNARLRWLMASRGVFLSGVDMSRISGDTPLFFKRVHRWSAFVMHWVIDWWDRMFVRSA